MDKSRKHTLGPWELCEKGDYGDFGGNSRVIISDDRRLAVVHVSDQETDANARLIVASPDLYEALDAIHSWLVCAAFSGAEDMAQSFEEMERKARAALEKATDQEPP